MKSFSSGLLRPTLPRTGSLFCNFPFLRLVAVEARVILRQMSVSLCEVEFEEVECVGADEASAHLGGVSVVLKA